MGPKTRVGRSCVAPSLACVVLLAGGGASLAGDDAIVNPDVVQVYSFVELLQSLNSVSGTEVQVEVLIPFDGEGKSAFEAFSQRIFDSTAPANAEVDVIAPSNWGLVKAYVPPKRQGIEGLKFKAQGTEMVMKAMAEAGGMTTMKSGWIFFPELQGPVYSSLKAEPFVAIGWPGLNDFEQVSYALAKAPFSVSKDGATVSVYGTPIAVEEMVTNLGVDDGFELVGGEIGGIDQEKLRKFFPDEVVRCIEEQRKSSGSMRICYNLHTQRDKAAGWLPRTEQSVKSDRYDYGLYVRPPLERIVGK